MRPKDYAEATYHAPVSPVTLRLSQDPEADELLSRDPLAQLIGMVLDQQIPLEKAFRGPFDLRERMGGRLDAHELADADPDELAEVFARPPALHRFPRSMAKRVQEMCAHLVEHYGGDAAAVWDGASDGKALLSAVKALPGFGDQKARIFLALLGKQYGFDGAGWREAAGDYGAEGTFKSVADIVNPESLTKVRENKRAAKAAAKKN